MNPLRASTVSKNQAGTPPAASLEGDVVTFASAAALQHAAKQVIERGLLQVRTTILPRSLEDVRFRFAFGDGSFAPLVGRIRFLRGLDATIEIKEGREAVASQWAKLQSGESKALAPLSGAERRRTERRESNCRVRIGDEMCLSRNLSPAGVCVATHQIFAIGAVVSGVITMGATETPFRGEVRWCQLPPPGGRGRGSLGIRFLKEASSPAAPNSVVAAPRATTQPDLPKLASPRPMTRVATPPPVLRSSERRTRHRARRRLKVNIGQTTGFTVDTNGTGLSMETSKALTPGTQVSGVVFIDSRQFPFTGEVRWARAGNPHAGILARMGIAFRDPSPELVAATAASR
ncbi:MAG: PilZ domain-containing protein [Myxococcaceae bacterium]